MVTVLIAAIVAMVISIVAGPRFIRFLRLREYGQQIREEGPAGHVAKQGTPTMGGLLIIFAASAPFLILTNYSTPGLTVLFCMVGCGSIGFLDDYIKLTHRRSLGLNGRWKLLLLLVITGVVAWVAYHRDFSTDLYMPGFKIPLSWAWYPFLFLIIAGAANGVNLTDGIDGLAAGTGIIAVFTFTAMTVIAYIRSGPPGHREVRLLDLSIIGAALIGSIIGFLWYNAFPAEVFMGDTGLDGDRRCARRLRDHDEDGGAAPAGRRHLPRRGGVGDPPGRELQVPGPAHLPDDADPPPFRDEGLVGDQDHGALLDPDRDPLRVRVRALLPLLLPLLQRMTILVLDCELLAEALAGLGEDELLIAVDPSAARLEELQRRFPDPRITYLIGDGAVIPVPSASVDRVLGAGSASELRRVLRR